MKKILISILLLVSCSGQNSSAPIRYNAETYDFSPYANKTVNNIRYCDDCGYSGDLLIITFTDGTQVKVYAYKYPMQIQK